MSLDATQEEIRALAQQIADMASRSDVECYCKYWKTLEGKRWYLTNLVEDDDAEYVRIALRYLTLRGRINVHPLQPHLVNFHGHD